MLHSAHSPLFFYFIFFITLLLLHSPSSANAEDNGLALFVEENTKISSGGSSGSSSGSSGSSTAISATMSKTRTSIFTTTLFVEEKTVELVANSLVRLRMLKMPYLLMADTVALCGKVKGDNCYPRNEKYDRGLEYFKLSVVTMLIGKGKNVLLLEPDVILKDNPVWYFDHTVDMNIMAEIPCRASVFEQTKCWSENTGLLYMKSTPASKSFLLEVGKFMAMYGHFSESISRALETSPSLTVAKLDRNLFPNGFVGFLQASPFHTGLYLETVAYRADWTNLAGTKLRFRELDEWYLDSNERYTQARRYITYSTQDDMITAEMEKDYLSLTFLLAKLLNRGLILPKFHCYYADPAHCVLDALFDPTPLANQPDVYENAFLRDSQVPSNNLRRRRIAVRSFSSVDSLLSTLETEANMPLIELSFPHTKYYAASSNIKPRAIFSLLESSSAAIPLIRNISQTVMFNTQTFLNPKYNAWMSTLEETGFTCVITSSFQMEKAADKIKEISHSKYVYIFPHPAQITRIGEMRDFFKKTLPMASEIYSFDNMWVGSQHLPKHSLVAYSQIKFCSNAEQVIVNIWEPAWIIDGVCSKRNKITNKSYCVDLHPDPWKMA